jgi:hypothetical protein
VFSLLGLLLVLGAVALADLRPWESSSVAPGLSLAPGIGVALGDSTVVAREGAPGVGTGGLAAPRPPAGVSAPVAVSAPEPRAFRPKLAVSPGRPLHAAVPVPISSPPAAEPPSQPIAAAPAPTPEPAAAQAPPPPLVATVENGGQGTPGGPVGSGASGGEPEGSCEGDEYLITVIFEEAEVEEEGYGEAEADILIQSLGADGSEAEAQLRGDLNDVRELVATLVSGGDCVQVDVQPLPGADPVVEASSAAAEVAEAGGSPGPVLP